MLGPFIWGLQICVSCLELRISGLVCRVQEVRGVVPPASPAVPTSQPGPTPTTLEFWGESLAFCFLGCCNYVLGGFGDGLGFFLFRSRGTPPTPAPTNTLGFKSFGFEDWGIGVLGVLLGAGFRVSGLFCQLQGAEVGIWGGGFGVEG